MTRKQKVARAWEDYEDRRATGKAWEHQRRVMRELIGKRAEEAYGVFDVNEYVERVRRELPARKAAL